MHLVFGDLFVIGVYLSSLKTRQPNVIICLFFLIVITFTFLRFIIYLLIYLNIIHNVILIINITVTMIFQLDISFRVIVPSTYIIKNIL